MFWSNKIKIEVSFQFCLDCASQDAVSLFTEEFSPRTTFCFLLVVARIFPCLYFPLKNDFPWMCTLYLSHPRCQIPAHKVIGSMYIRQTNTMFSPTKFCDDISGSFLQFKVKKAFQFKKRIFLNKLSETDENEYFIFGLN